MTTSQANIQQLFATPLISLVAANSAALNQALLAEIAVRRASEGSVSRSNVAGWHSASDFFSRTEPAHAQLAGLIQRGDLVRDPADRGGQQVRGDQSRAGWLDQRQSARRL